MPEALTEQRIAGLRQRIRDIAIRQFSQQGINQVSMRSIARELGYSATALYSYYKNKDEILAAIRCEGLNRLAENLEKALIGAEDPQLLTQAFVKSYGKFSIAEADTYRLVFALDQPPPGIYPELEQALLRMRNVFRYFIRAAIGDEIQDVDTNSHAHMLWAGLHGLVVLRMSGSLSPSSMAAEDLHGEMVQLLLRGTISLFQGQVPEEKIKTGQQMAFNL